MTITAFASPISGIWPLGMITVGASGTPVALNTNVGAQTANQRTGPTDTVRQLIFTGDSDNSGAIYVLRRVVGQTVTKLTTNFIVAVIYPGQTQAIPNGSLGISASLNVDDYLIDADSNGDKVFPSAYFG